MARVERQSASETLFRTSPERVDSLLWSEQRERERASIGVRKQRCHYTSITIVETNRMGCFFACVLASWFTREIGTNDGAVRTR